MTRSGHVPYPLPASRKWGLPYLHLLRQFSMGARRLTATSGFSLVELLVVVAILTVLLAMLMPALENVRESGRRIKCMANLRQIYSGCLAYATDFEGWFPPGSNPNIPCQDGWLWYNGGTNGVYFPLRSTSLTSAYQQLWRCPSIKFGKKTTMGQLCTYAYFGGAAGSNNPTNWLVAQSFDYGYSRASWQNGFGRSPKTTITLSPVSRVLGNPAQAPLIMDNAFIGDVQPFIHPFPATAVTDSNAIMINNHSSRDMLTPLGENIVFADGHGEWVGDLASRPIRCTVGTNRGGLWLTLRY